MSISKKAARLSGALGLVALLALSALGAASGCGPSVVTSVCNQVCTCQPCTVADHQDCQSKGDGEEAASSNLGCGSQFDAYATCIENNVHCQSSKAITTLSNCTAEIAALRTCTKGTLPFDACTAAENLLTSCGISSSSGQGGGTAPSCTGSNLCSADCTNAATCAELKDAFSGMPTATSKPFLDCETSCISAP